MIFFCLRKTRFEQILEKTGIKVISQYVPRSGAKKTQFKNLVTAFGDIKPDFFYFLKDEQLRPSLLKKMRKISPKTKFIMNYGDQRGCIPPLIQERKDLLDCLLINNEDPIQFKMYKAFGIPKTFTFYHGVPVQEFKDFPCKITNDVFFGGGNFNHKKFPLSKFRYDFIMRVQKTFDLLVYGGGWPFKTCKRVPRQQYARVLRTTKLNLGINHYNVVRYYNRRLFECMGSGRLHITYYIPGMEKHFENYKHLIWFNTIPQGIRIIHNMLNHPKTREKIAAKGKKHVFKNYSFEIRAQQLKDILKKL